MNTLRVWDENGNLALTEQVVISVMGTYMLPDTIRDLPAGNYVAQLDELPSMDIEVRAPITK